MSSEAWAVRNGAGAWRVFTRATSALSIAASTRKGNDPVARRNSTPAAAKTSEAGEGAALREGPFGSTTSGAAYSTVALPVGAHSPSASVRPSMKRAEPKSTRHRSNTPSSACSAKGSRSVRTITFPQEISPWTMPLSTTSSRARSSNRSRPMRATLRGDTRPSSSTASIRAALERVIPLDPFHQQRGIALDASDAVHPREALEPGHAGMKAVLPAKRRLAALPGRVVLRRRRA